MLKLSRQARETLEDVSDASKTVIASTEWASVALVAVAGVSLLALALAVISLNRGGRP